MVIYEAQRCTACSISDETLAPVNGVTFTELQQLHPLRAVNTFYPTVIHRQCSAACLVVTGHN